MLMTNCPTEETLAAFIDDRLDAPTRREVTEHVASCGECRELVMMAADFEMSETPSNVRRPPFGWIASAAALAAAAVFAIIVLLPAFAFRPEIMDVIAAAQLLEHRPSVGRLSTGFPRKHAAPSFRGGGESQFDQVNLWEIVDKAKDPHVSGVALLHNADNRELYGLAIDKLKEAYDKAPPEERDAIAIDYAAALLSRWADDEDHKRALLLSEEVLKRKQSPEARWNRAVALELLGEDEKAAQAWDDYLKLDSSSPWAKEAQERQRNIRELMN
jgi:hypothetical protein